MTTKMERVLRYAIDLVAAERFAQGAPVGQKSAANERHDEAKRRLRQAVDTLTGGKP
jgi:hypothetical protein